MTSKILTIEAPRRLPQCFRAAVAFADGSKAEVAFSPLHPSKATHVDVLTIPTSKWWAKPFGMRGPWLPMADDRAAALADVMPPYVRLADVIDAHVSAASLLRDYPSTGEHATMVAEELAEAEEGLRLSRLELEALPLYGLLERDGDEEGDAE